MINNFSDFCLWIYVTVDDIWKQIAPLFDRLGPEPVCGDRELVSMATIGECRGWNLETEMLSQWREYPELFPHVPTQSRFNRRRRDLMYAFNLIRQVVLKSLAIAQDRQCVIDSLPLPVVQFYLVPGSTGQRQAFEAAYGPNHWRMRGTIEVVGESELEAVGESGSPLYAELGLDLDAPRSAAVLPAGKPLAAVVDSQLRETLSDYISPGYYRSHAPYETWQKLRTDSAFSTADDQMLWQFTASVWQANATPDELANGGQLFAQNCAACHGEGGAGDGVFADELDAAAMPGTMSGGAMWQSPADLTDPARIGRQPCAVTG